MGEGQRALSKAGIILVIDDDPGIRLVLRKTLERAGYEVHEAADGEAGLKQFRDVKPDLVITDIIMPEREGVETIVALRQQSPATPIVAISGGGGGGADYLTMAKKLGAARALQKPFSVATALRVVDELLSPPEAEKP
jgi:DNA-binding NtrC family response regulator